MEGVRFLRQGEQSVFEGAAESLPNLFMMIWFGYELAALALRMHCFEGAAGAARLWWGELRDLREKFWTSPSKI